VGAPRAIQLLVTQSVQYEVNSLPETTRDLVGQGSGGPILGPSADPARAGFAPEVDTVWGTFDDNIAAVRREMPPAVERSVGDAQYAVTLAPNLAAADWHGAPDTEISLGFDPRMMQHVTMIAGTEPTAMTADVPNQQPTEIMLSQVIADQMEWELD